MGRIVVQTEVANPFDGDKSVRCGMLVDTGAGALILPSAWESYFKVADSIVSRAAGNNPG